MKTRLAVLLMSMFLLPASIWAQANVNEGLETATVYVDATLGSDSNPGTQAQPLQTVGAAMTLAIANNRANVGTKVIVNPGTYRESIAVGSDIHDTSLPITVQAASTGTAIISGAEVWTGWQPSGGNPSIFTNSWPYQWGLCARATGGAPFEQDVVLRREMIFVNGIPLTQVLSLSQMSFAGTFFADESSATVYIWPPAGTPPSTATIEVATRPNLFFAYGRTNIVLRGLTFQYANSCRSDHAVDFYGPTTNLLLDSDAFVWNNSSGLKIEHPTTNFTVQNSVANHNGQLGFGDFEVKNGLWQNDQANFNNWRGAQGAYYDWGGAGAYFFSEHAVTISGFTAAYNLSNGLHWDTDDENITVTNLVAAGNLQNGIFIEKNQGPVSVSNSNFCGNAPNGAAGSSFSGGVELRDSEAVTLAGNGFVNNGTAQINIQGQPGGIFTGNWETGATYDLVTRNMTLTQNTVVATGAGQQVFTDSYLGGADWIAFQSSLTADNNTWWNASNSSAFTIPAGETIDLAGWQSATGQDAHSVFAAPGTGAVCNVTPDFPDYWAVVDNITQTISASGPATFALSVVPLNFNGTVQLSADGINSINGASAQWSQTSINTSGAATYTVNAPNTAPAGTFPLTLLANNGGTTHTVTVSVVLPGTPVAPPSNLSAAVQ